MGTLGDTVITVPTTGGTTAIAGGTSFQVLNGAGTLATHTVTLPNFPTMAGKEITIHSVLAITALTVSDEAGAPAYTVVGAPTTLAANGFFRMRLAGTVWRRVG